MAFCYHFLGVYFINVFISLNGVSIVRDERKERERNPKYAAFHNVFSR